MFIWMPMSLTVAVAANSLEAFRMGRPVPERPYSVGNLYRVYKMLLSGIINSEFDVVR